MATHWAPGIVDFKMATRWAPGIFDFKTQQDPITDELEWFKMSQKEMWNTMN